MKKRIISFVLILTLVLPLFYYVVNAQEANETTYTVEQVTSAADINSQNVYRYILVYERDDGRNVALAAVKGSSSSSNAISRNNYRDVTIENGKLSTETTDNILWNFTKSKASVLEDGDHPVIRSDAEVISGSSRRDIKISSSSSAGGNAGIRFVENGNGYTFEPGENNTFKLHENNCEDPDNSYIGFNSYFRKVPADEAANFKIFKVVRSYNYESSHFLSSEQIAQMENVTVTKEVTKYENYGDNGIALVKLKTKGTSLEKECDVILILDDSSSVYTEAPEDTTKTRAQVIREDALLFSQKLLEANPDNRISVIKFARNITNEDAVDAIGFSSDIDDVETMIGGDIGSVSYGTDYSVAFRKANEVFEAKSDPNHGKVVLLISDGMPNYYNGIAYNVFSETDDATGDATNWIDFVTNAPLEEAMLMTQTGTAIYTIGSLEENSALSSGNGYFITAQATKDVLTHIATESANFYDFDKIETELENILNRLAKEFNYYPTNAEVKDKISADIGLLDRKVKDITPEIVFLRNGEEVEKITFTDDGTAAYSSVLGPDTNILNVTNETPNFDAKYVSFDGNTVTWKIGDLFRDEFELDYYIYLKKAANINGDGNDLPTGTYPTSDEVTITYTDVTNQEVVEETEKPTLDWVNPNKPAETSPSGGGAAPGGGGDPGGGGIVQTIYNGLLPKTGSASAFIVTVVGALLVALAVRIKKMADKAKTKKRK